MPLCVTWQAEMIFSPIPPPHLETGPHAQRTTLTVVCSSPAKGQVHKVVELHMIHLSCGSLNMTLLEIIPGKVRSLQSYVYLGGASESREVVEELGPRQSTPVASITDHLYTRYTPLLP